MAIRLGRFEMPSRLVRSEEESTPTYAKFIAEPLEAGYGNTLGNSLRRVLLSSLEGAAVSAVQIEGVSHEFQTLDGVVEDVTDIVLNLKGLLLRTPTRDPRKLRIDANRSGQVTAKDIEAQAGVEILNPDLVICTLDKKRRLRAELDVRTGRGYVPAEYNKTPETPIGVVPIDSLFSPVRRVRYEVENTRVGQRTDYDRLILEVWTDGRVGPEDALVQAAEILKRHVEVFRSFDKDATFEFEEDRERESEERNKLRQALNMSVNEIELSVRAANCLNNANITTVGQLAQKSEAEMLKYRNFGKKSLGEIREKLEDLGRQRGVELSLGMKIDADLLEALPAPAEAHPAPQSQAEPNPLGPAE